MPDSPFSIDLGSLKARQKTSAPSDMARVDIAAEQHGFVAREPHRGRGRQPSPRTGQIHAKVMPDVAEAIADEARRRGVQQGVIIEEAWGLYRRQNKI